MPAVQLWHLNLSVCGWLTDSLTSTATHTERLQLHVSCLIFPSAPIIFSPSFLQPGPLTPIITLKIIDRTVSPLCTFFLQDRRESFNWSKGFHRSESPIAWTFGESVYFLTIGLGGHGFLMAGRACASARARVCMFANWMNELICYRNEVKADRRPSGRPNRQDRKQGELWRQHNVLPVNVCVKQRPCNWAHTLLHAGFLFNWILWDSFLSFIPHMLL